MAVCFDVVLIKSGRGEVWKRTAVDEAVLEPMHIGIYTRELMSMMRDILVGDFQARVAGHLLREQKDGNLEAG